MTISSPLNNQVKTLTVNVMRGGGTFGVVEIKWIATANGECINFSEPFIH